MQSQHDLKVTRSPLPIQEHPAFSILLPFRNPGEDFKLAVQSIFCQTFSDWELILMDDGSSDGSLEFAQSIQDTRVRVFSDGLHLHLNIRLNQMIDLARGIYIARMDADDMMHPQRLERQYEVLQRSGANTVVGTGAIAIDVQSCPRGIRLVRNAHRSGFEATGSVMHATVAASREWFIKNRYSEDPVYFRSQDAELWFRTAPHTTFLNLREPLYFVRELGNFSLEKHLWSALGILSVAAQLRETSRSASAKVMSIRIAKLWLMCMAGCFGRGDMLVRRRAARLSHAERFAAEMALREIQATILPISSGLHLAYSRSEAVDA